jgi:short-subunit dehydrogenase
MELKRKYGEWALITGSSSGIGKEFAYRLASERINLVLVARRKDRLKSIAEELTHKHGIKVICAPIDLCQDNFMEKLSTIVAGINIGILVNNAGFGSNGYFSDADLQHEANMVKVNCVAPTILTHHFVPQMIHNRRGAIIFLGSIVAFQPTPFMATYSASKAFNLFLGDALWYELKQFNIDVLSLNPGGTDTEFQRIANSSTGPAPRTVEQVVNTALKALGKKPSVIDGMYNKLLAFSSRFGSRRAVVSMAGYITKLFYKKNG